MKCWLALAFLLNTSVSRAADEPVDLRQIHKRLVAPLAKSSIARLAQETMRQRLNPADPHEVVSTFVIYQMAGYGGKLKALFPAIAASHQQIPPSTLGELGDRLIESRQWDLARHYFEAVPQAEPERIHQMLWEWMDSTPAEEIDAWLEARVRENRFWAGVRFALADKAKRMPVLVAEYRSKLEAKPGDFASALELAKGCQNIPEAPVDWLADTFQPAAVSEALEVAVSISRKAPRVAIVLLEKAHPWAFGPADREFMNRVYSMRQMMVLNPDPERDFRLLVKHGLMEAYRDGGDSQKAQKLMQELAAEAPDGFSGLSLRTAGAVQMQSGQRVIENRIRDAEKMPENKSSPEYWRHRGDYFMGRKEWKDAESAYRQGLALAKVPEGEEKQAGKGSADGRDRHLLAWSLARCLKEAGEWDKSRELLLAETSLWPPNAGLTDSLISNLAAACRSEELALSTEEPVLWTYIEQRQDWSYGVERLLTRLGDSVRKESMKEERKRFWRKAETAALRNPKKHLLLAGVLTSCGRPDRAIEILELAVPALPEGELRDSAYTDLYAAHLEMGQWREAERLFPKISSSRDLDGQTNALGELSRVAARAGASKDALRLWKLVMDRDRTYIHDLEALAHRGLKPGLLRLYTALAKSEPDCTLARQLVEKVRRLP